MSRGGENIHLSEEIPLKRIKIPRLEQSISFWSCLEEVTAIFSSSFFPLLTAKELEELKWLLICYKNDGDCFTNMLKNILCTWIILGMFWFIFWKLFQTLWSSFLHWRNKSTITSWAQQKFSRMEIYHSIKCHFTEVSMGTSWDFSRMILLLKWCMKKALSSFRGTNHRQVLFWEGQQATKTDPNSWAEPGIQPENAEEISWNTSWHWDATTSKTHSQAGHLYPAAAKTALSGHGSQLQGWSRWKRSQSKCSLPETPAAWRERSWWLLCTPQHALNLWVNFQSSGTAQCSCTLVSLMTECVWAGSADWWFIYSIMGS